MQIIYDDTFFYSPVDDEEAMCHLKVYSGKGSAIIVATDVYENSGGSIAKYPEVLSAHIVNSFHLDPHTTRYIEHYLPKGKSQHWEVSSLVKSIEAYFLVNFTWSTINKVPSFHLANQPRRTLISKVQLARFTRQLYEVKSRVHWQE